MDRQGYSSSDSVSVIGMGYVGLTTACCLAHAGFKVLGVETNAARLETLRQGEAPIFEPGLSEILAKAIASGNLRFTETLQDALDETSIVFVAVGTPSLADGRVDLEAVHAVAREIVRLATRPLTVVMKSTVPPGTGASVMRRFFPAAKVRIDYVSNPEFLREGRAVYDWFNPDRIVVGGDDEEAVNRVLQLYRDIEASKVVTSVASAEMVKYASNAFLATKISFINEIANLCELIDANVEEVATAVGLDKRIGGDFLKAGLGYGGSCFPKDTRGLDYLAAFNGYDFRLLKAVIEVNSRQWIRAISKLRSRLDGLYGRKICVLGLTFKPETDDLRDAPALNIINQLVSEGAQVKACDPVSWRKASAVLPQGVQTYPEPYQAVTGCEAVVLATEWSHFRSADWGVIKGLMAEPHLVVDGRNALDQQALSGLGFEYCGVGRIESPGRDLAHQKNRNRK